EGQAEVLFQRGLLLSSVDPAGARVALEKSRELARVIPSEQQDIAATLQLSNVAYLGGDVDGASRMAADGVARAQRAGMNYLAARGLVDLGQTKLGRRDYAGAEASFRQSLELSHRYAMRRIEARALFNLANLHQVVGPKEDALTEGAPAYEYFRKAGFRIEAVQCLLVIARAHRDLGHGKEAIASFQQALAAARDLPDPIRVLQAEQGLAVVFLNHGRWPEAAAQFERARQSAAALNDRDNVARALVGLGSVQWRLGRFGEAEQTLAQLPRETVTLHLKAEIALGRGRNAEAASIARQVFAAKDASPQRAQSARCLAGLALARSGHAAEGRALCEPAVADLLPIGDRFAVMEARIYLAEILLALGQHGLALEVLGQVAGAAAA
ncbi:MAG TPA: tetratricopeptide repeat protein, partial [Ktedonobacterales bacterium]|nr:tetratricopeptide repeat protein [Ktedonobacterales bacterium]